MEISQKVTSDLFEENREIKHKLDEATTKAESLQSKREGNKTNILLNEKLNTYDIATRRFQEFLNKETTQIKDQNEIEKLNKRLQVKRVEVDMKRAEAIQLIQPVDAEQNEKLEKCSHALLTHADHGDWDQYNEKSIFKSKAEMQKSDLHSLLPLCVQF